MKKTKVFIITDIHSGDMQAYPTLKSVLRTLGTDAPGYQSAKYQVNKYGHFKHKNLTIKIVYYAA